MEAVNLLPREALGGRGLRRVDPLLVGGGVITCAVAVAVAGGFLLEHRHVNSERQHLAAIRAELAQVRAQSASSAATSVLARPAVLGQEQPWLQALGTALSTRVAWDRTLAELADVVPSDVTLSSLTLGPAAGGTPSTSTTSTTSSSPAPAAATGSLALAGKAASHRAVATLLSRLKLVPGVSQIELGPTTADPTNGSVSFQIDAQVSA